MQISGRVLCNLAKNGAYQNTCTAVRKECKRNAKSAKANVCSKDCYIVLGMSCCEPQQFWPCAFSFFLYFYNDSW